MRKVSRNEIGRQQARINEDNQQSNILTSFFFQIPHTKTTHLIKTGKIIIKKFMFSLFGMCLVRKADTEFDQKDVGKHDVEAGEWLRSER